MPEETIQTLIISFSAGILGVLFVLFLKKKWGFFNTTVKVVTEYKDRDFFKLIRSLLKPHHNIVYSPPIGTLINVGVIASEIIEKIKTDTVDMVIFDSKTSKIVFIIYLKSEDSRMPTFEKAKEAFLSGLFKEAGHPFMTLNRVNDFDSEKIRGLLYPEYSVDINDEGLKELVNEIFNQKEKE